MENDNFKTAFEIAQGYKYTIWYLLQKMTGVERTEAMHYLPIKLGVAYRTFERWMYLKIDDSSTIPADRLYELSTFFGVNMISMWTNGTENPHLKNLHIDRLKIQKAHSL